MPRKEKEIEGFGPVADFARALRARKRESGKTLREMARLAGYSQSALSLITNSRSLPKSAQVRAYIKGCGVTNQDEIESWLARRDEAASAALAFSPDLSGCRTTADLLAALAALAQNQFMAKDFHHIAAELAMRLLDRAGEKVGDHRIEAVPADKILSALNDQPPPPTEPLLGNLVFAVGGTQDDLAHWCSRWRELQKAQPPSGSMPASTEGPKRARITRRRALIGIAAAGVAGLGSWRYRDSHDQSPPGSAPGRVSQSNAPPQVTPMSNAKDVLMDLARQVSSIPEDLPDGRYTHIHSRVWSRDTTAGDPYDPGTYNEEFLWWDQDRWGRKLTITTARTGPPMRNDKRLRGGLSLVIDNPADSPDELRGQMEPHQSSKLGTAGRLRTVSDLYRIHLLNRIQRAAILEVLAHSENLVYNGDLPDPARRNGVSVSADVEVDDAGARQQDRLIFNASDGTLLCHTQNVLIVSGGHSAWTTTQHTLYLDRTRTDRTA